MTKPVLICLMTLAWMQLSVSRTAISQEPAAGDAATDVEIVLPADDAEVIVDGTEDVDTTEASEGDGVNAAKEQVKDVVDQTQDKVSEIAAEIDKDERAIGAKSGILGPIYALAETMSFSAFHWVAFMLMITGVVSFALQLVLGKLVALTKLGFSFTEILSDALGLAISLIGLVLTTQAAAENSTFTESAFAVISATIVGVVLGFIFYIWGQKQELQAIDARKARVTEDK